MSTKEAARKASAAFHAKRKADGWRKITVWLSPSAAARLDALKDAHGYATDEAIRRLLNCSAADAPPPEVTARRKVSAAIQAALPSTGGRLPQTLPVGPVTPAPGSRLKNR